MSLQIASKSHPPRKEPDRKYVGIVGGGPAGLYAAMLLQQKGYFVHLFEASNRVGGRIYTHRFSSEPNQYFEAGAMRIPKNKYQQPFFDLVKAINENQKISRTHHVKLIPYTLETSYNRYDINEFLSTYRDASVSGSAGLCASDVQWPGFPPRASGATDFYNTPIGVLLDSALKPLFNIIESDGFEKGFEKIVKQYDDFSFRFYLKSVHSWPDAAIDCVETVASQTNQFSLSVVEFFMQNTDFGVEDWVTIADGMDRLPQAMANIIGLENITFNARVDVIKELGGQTVQVQASGADGDLQMNFDHIILAIPPAALRMISSRPPWGADKELAIRSMHYEALWKMGMRFKKRFWEKPSWENPPEKGGQSITDLPIRWIVLPSYGIDDEGPGVLLVYAWMTDAQAWLPLSPSARRGLALDCLEVVYYDVDNIRELLIETFDVTWSSESATGDAMFLPGQWANRFETARRPEGNIYFAGEHLSYCHTWISGALLSAAYAVEQIIESPERSTITVESPRPKTSGEITEPPKESSSTQTSELPLFEFTPKSSYHFKKVQIGHRDELSPRKPQNLGADPNAPLVGPRVTHIPGLSIH